MSKFPGEFPEYYPPSGKVYDAVLERFKTKEQLEETLARNGDEEAVNDESPLVPFNIVPEYAIKWITFVPGSSRKQLTLQASERITAELKRLFDGKEYGEIARIGNNMRGVDFSRYLCPLITTRGQFNGLFDYLARCGMFTNFLAFGNLAFVEEEIAGSKSEHAFKFFFAHGHLKEAIVLALKEDRHDLAIVLLRVVQEKCANEDAEREELDYGVSFGEFIKGIIKSLAPEQDSLPIKRFFTLCGEELKKYPVIFETICQELLRHLAPRLHETNSEKLLDDFIGQPSLLTPTAFAKGLLCYDEGDSDEESDFDSDTSDVELHDDFYKMPTGFL